MSTANNRRSQPGGGGEVMLPWLILAVVGVGGGALYAGAHLGHRFAGLDSPPSNPIDVTFGVIGGDVAWPTASTVVAAGVLIMLAVLVGLVMVLRSSRKGGGRRSSRVDHAGRYMGVGRDIESISRKSARATAARLGVQGEAAGIPIGRAVATKAELVGSWEDLHLDIWGPRTGKTTSRAVPAILEAPGPVIVTSNKRDVLDATRDPRAKAGKVWVFDPQGVAEEPQDWWWNPLSYVVDEVKAKQLAGHFAAYGRPADAKTDAHFDPAGKDLLAGMLLAAAVAGRPITQVYKWLTRPTDEEPVDILLDNDYELIAAQIEGVINSPEKLRGSVYQTSVQMASCLTQRSVLRWVTAKEPFDARPQFDPHAFVADGGTLYSLSREGQGSAGALVTALTVAVVEAAEARAVRSPGGRLPVPMLAALDEAANVCRWHDLPDLYSHYGSRGIVMMTILQSWSQGCRVWGEGGMKTLWSAANVAVYGGGVREEAFLEMMSKLVGDYDKQTSSVSTSQGRRTHSHQLQRERILDVADLAALPKGRAVVFASGARPTLIETQPWMTSKHADAVKASIQAHDPQAGNTISTLQNDYQHARNELRDVSVIEAR